MTVYILYNEMYKIRMNERRSVFKVTCFIRVHCIVDIVYLNFNTIILYIYFKNKYIYILLLSILCLDHMLGYMV